MRARKYLSVGRTGKALREEGATGGSGSRGFLISVGPSPLSTRAGLRGAGLLGLSVPPLSVKHKTVLSRAKFIGDYYYSVVFLRVLSIRPNSGSDGWHVDGILKAGSYFPPSFYRFVRISKNKKIRGKTPRKNTSRNKNKSGREMASQTNKENRK